MGLGDFDKAFDTAAAPAHVGTSYSANNLKLVSTTNTGTGARDIGEGDPLYVNLRVTESFDQLLTTLTVYPTYSPTDDMSDANAVKLPGITILGAHLVAYAQFSISLSPVSLAQCLTAAGIPAFPGALNYLGLTYVVAGASDFSAGALEAYLGTMPCTKGFGATILSTADPLAAGYVGKDGELEATKTYPAGRF